MKHKLAAIFVFFGFIVILFWNRTEKNMINMEFVESGATIFEYEDESTSHRLSLEELNLLKHMFAGKRLYSDSPSCGFTDHVSVRFNDSQTFCVACDTCPIIFWKEKNRFFRLTEEEKNQLYELLGKYGFTFPCV